VGGERSRACLGQLGWREPARSSPDDMLAKNVAYQHIDRSTDQAERLRLLPAQVAACSSDPETLVSWLAVLRTAFVARLLGPRSPTVTAGRWCSGPPTADALRTATESRAVPKTINSL